MKKKSLRMTLLILLPAFFCWALTGALRQGEKIIASAQTADSVWSGTQTSANLVNMP